MQGTIVMLVALSGLGCHHKACDVTFAPSGYYCMGGCLPEENETDYPAPAYARGHMRPGGCTDGTAGQGGHGYSASDVLLSGLMYLGGGWGGSWKRHHTLSHGVDQGGYGPGYGYWANGYGHGDPSPAVFGSVIPIYETPMNSGPASPGFPLVNPMYPTPNTGAAGSDSAAGGAGNGPGYTTIPGAEGTPASPAAPGGPGSPAPASPPPRPAPAAGAPVVPAEPAVPPPPTPVVPGVARNGTRAGS